MLSLRFSCGRSGGGRSLFSRPAETFIVYDSTTAPQSKAEFYIYTLNIYNYSFLVFLPPPEIHIKL
jgi:hypothetical protein